MADNDGYCPPGTELPTRTVKRFGWKPDLPDFRDKNSYEIGRKLKVGLLPPEVMLHHHPYEPPIWNQGQLGSCTAQAIAHAVEATMGELGHEAFTPSRLAIYYGERAIEGTINSDDGAYIRDGFKVISHEGFAPESLWPYEERRFAERPPDEYYREAVKWKCVEYGRVDQRDASHMQRILATGDPIVFGFSVYSNIDRVGPDGILELPQATDHMQGGHAVVKVGYKKINGKWYWIVRNSWGTGWGDGGYFYMPFEYTTNTDLAADFWRLSLVTPQQ